MFNDWLTETQHSPINEHVEQILALGGWLFALIDWAEGEQQADGLTETRKQVEEKWYDSKYDRDKGV